MNDIYNNKSKPTSRKQQISTQLALLGDELVRLNNEKIDILALVVELKMEFKTL